MLILSLVLLSVLIILLSYSKLKDLTSISSYKFIKNYDMSYSEVVNLTLPEEEKEKEYYLSDLKYDISSLYLDWSEIEAERKRLQEEEEALKQQQYEEQHKNDFVPNENQIVEEKPQQPQQTPSVIKVEGSMDLPNISDTSFKGYMCLHKVTYVDSYQYKFLHSGDFEFHTDENGILMYDNYYVVAMASYYTKYKVGSTFRITLDSGVVFDVITGDEKADKDTDELNMYRPKSNGRGEIVEFIIACGAEGANCNKYHTMSAEHRALGNLSSLGFQGNVVKVEKLDDYSVVNRLYGTE